MRLEGSCHCGAVRFSVEAAHPAPFNLCVCSICRKTAGGGGFGINLGASTKTLAVFGAEHVRRHEATENHQRNFCGSCGSALWGYSSSRPDLIHPFASAIDRDLPVPPERTHMMLDHGVQWVEPQLEANDKTFAEYPDESLAVWYERTGMTR
ncbi:MAG: GFA family protein [Pseudomonadota bacterium]